MIFAEMVVEVQRTLREYGGLSSFLATDDDVKDALNEGMHQMTDASEWYIRQQQLPVGGTTYYDLSSLLPDFMSLRRIFNPRTNRWLTGVDYVDLDERTYARWETVIGEPQHMFMRSPYILGLFPKPPATTGPASGSMRIDEFSAFPSGSGLTAAERLRFVTVGFARVGVSSDLDVWYAADYPDLVANADTLPIPEEFHEIPVEYACGELLAQDRELSKANIHFGHYNDLLYGNPNNPQKGDGLVGWVRQQALAGGVGVFGDPVYGVLPGPPAGGRG